MAEVFYPFDGGAGATVTETQWMDMATAWSPDGVRLDHGTGLPYGDSSGMQVKVPTLRAVVGGHFYYNNAIKTIAVAGNSTGAARLDRVVIRADRTADTISAVVVTGTTSLPALVKTTATWDVPLATITVPNGALTIAAGDVKDDRAIATGIDGASGSIVKVAQDFTSSGTLSITDIPPRFEHLRLHVMARGTAVAENVPLRVQFNQDTSASYYWQNQYADNATMFSGRASNMTKLELGIVPASSLVGADGSLWGHWVVDIAQYTNAVARTISSTGGYLLPLRAPVVGQYFGVWHNSTAQLRRIDSTENALQTGSQMELYGIR